MRKQRQGKLANHSADSNKKLLSIKEEVFDKTPNPAVAENKDQEEVELKKPK